MDAKNASGPLSRFSISSIASETILNDYYLNRELKFKYWLRQDISYSNINRSNDIVTEFEIMFYT